MIGPFWTKFYFVLILGPNSGERFTGPLVLWFKKRDCVVHSEIQKSNQTWSNAYEPRRQKTGLRGFRPGPTQIRLRRLRKWLEACNFVFRKERDCIIRIAKTKALISFAVTAKLICVFVFRICKNPVFLMSRLICKSMFSHMHLMMTL